MIYQGAKIELPSVCLSVSTAVAAKISKNRIHPVIKAIQERNFNGVTFLKVG